MMIGGHDTAIKTKLAGAAATKNAVDAARKKWPEMIPVYAGEGKVTIYKSIELYQSFKIKGVADFTWMIGLISENGSMIVVCGDPGIKEIKAIIQSIRKAIR